MWDTYYQMFADQETFNLPLTQHELTLSLKNDISICHSQCTTASDFI